MICPRCKAEGLRSRISEGPITSTAMASSAFYDEDGSYHRHNLNKIRISYHCSNGHRWTVERSQPCGAGLCTFGREAPTIITEA